MRLITLTYDSITRTLSTDGTPAGTVVDDESTIIKVEGLPENYDTISLFFDVLVTTDRQFYYPFADLDASGQASLTNNVLAACNTGDLPVSLRILYTDQTIESSINQVHLSVSVYPDSTQSMADTFGGKILMREDGWTWGAEWNYRTGSVVYWDGSLYLSLIDDNLGNQPDESPESWTVIYAPAIQPYDITPSMDGTGTPGASSDYARGDHRHPTDTTREAIANKDQANGYAGLNSNGKIPISRLLVGHDTDTIPLIKGLVTSGQVLKYDATANGFIGQDLGIIYRFKGSVTNYEDLPANPQAGDVYNVVNAHAGHPAGTNWAWTGTEWDPLGGPIDLSNYVTNTALAQALLSYAIKSHASASTDYGKATASLYGHAKASSATPNMDGTASTGTDNGEYARGDHRHPTDTSRASAQALQDHAADSTAHVTTAERNGWNAKASITEWTIQGDGTTRSFSRERPTTSDPAVTIRDITTGELVITDIKLTTTNIIIEFGEPPAVGEDYKITIMGH